MCGMLRSISLFFYTKYWYCMSKLPQLGSSPKPSPIFCLSVRYLALKVPIQAPEYLTACWFVLLFGRCLTIFPSSLLPVQVPHGRVPERGQSNEETPRINFFSLLQYEDGIIRRRCKPRDSPSIIEPALLWHSARFCPEATWISRLILALPFWFWALVLGTVTLGHMIL